jgi:integrase
VSQTEEMQLQGPALSKFLGAIRSPFTSRVYLRCIQEFIQFLYANEMIQAKTVDAILTRDPDLVEQWILAWISEQKEQGLSVSIMHVRKSAVKLFYDVNKVQGGIAWKIIAKSMGENRKLRDRPYSREEIRKILDKADFRARVVILLLASTGMRIGAVGELKVADLAKMGKYGGIYQITVYGRMPSEYMTFCTPECARAIDEYLEFRKRHGEVIKPESPLIREQFDRAEAMRDFGRASNAKSVKVAGLVDLVRDALIASGIREVKPVEGTKISRIRHPVKQSHGFRKFYDTTTTQAGVHPLYIELLMGHDIALKGSYFRPTIQDMLEGNDRMLGYVAAIDALTINEENRLKQENQQIKHRNEELEGGRDEVQRLRAELEPLLALKNTLIKEGLLKESS